MDGLGDLGINLLASVIAGLAVWMFGRARRRLRTGRRRAFFGMTPEVGCTISVPRHAASDLTHGVHRKDAAAMIEIAATARDCGSTVDSLATTDDPFPASLGDRTEFCLGGPDANDRTAVHLRQLLPGVTFERYADAGPTVPLRVGGRTFARVEDVEEYVILARIATSGRPVFLISGQTAQTNLVAARLLKNDYESLIRTHGRDGRFCLVLRIDRPRDYGGGLTAVAFDATEVAFAAPAPSAEAPSDRAA